MRFFGQIKTNLKYLFVGVLSSLLFLWWVSIAEDDLLWQLIEPTYRADTTIKVGKNSKYVWTRFFWGSKEFDYTVERRIKRDENGNPICHGGVTCPSECNGSSASEQLEQCDYEHEWHDHAEAWDKPSIIWKATRILLSLVIALSITMILYNGMMYIIQTWQWKEAKDLTKNIAYIVIWILVALFSVVIITLIQSIPSTLDDWRWSSDSKINDNKMVE